MVKRIIVLIVFLFIFFPDNINASCSNQEIVRLKKIAANVNFNIDYIENENNVFFRVKVTNLHDDVYLIDDYMHKYIFSEEHPIEYISEYHFSAGANIRFSFYSDNDDCSGQRLYIKYINLPPYNYLYKDDLCNGIEEFKLCQKWIVPNFTYQEFKNQIEVYKNNDKNNKNNDGENDNDGIFYLVIDFLSKYYIYIYGSIIIVGAGSLYILNKKNNFNL